MSKLSQSGLIFIGGISDLRHQVTYWTKLMQWIGCNRASTVGETYNPEMFHKWSDPVGGANRLLNSALPASDEVTVLGSEFDSSDFLEEAAELERCHWRGFPHQLFGHTQSRCITTGISSTSFPASFWCNATEGMSASFRNFETHLVSPHDQCFRLGRTMDDFVLEPEFPEIDFSRYGGHFPRVWLRSDIGFANGDYGTKRIKIFTGFQRYWELVLMELALQTLRHFNCEAVLCVDWSTPAIDCANGAVNFVFDSSGLRFTNPAVFNPWKPDRSLVLRYPLPHLQAELDWYDSWLVAEFPGFVTGAEPSRCGVVQNRRAPSAYEPMKPTTERSLSD